MKVINRVLMQEVRGTWRYLLLIIFVMLFVVGLDAIAPWPFKILIDNVLEASPINPHGYFSGLFSFFTTREFLGLFVIFIFFLSSFVLSLFEYMKSILSKKVIKTMTANFSKRAFDNLQSLAAGFYKKQKIGDYIYRLSYDVSALGELLEEGVLPLLTSLLYVGVTTTIMFLISYKLTLVSLAVLPFLAIGLYFFNRNLAAATRRSEVYNSAAFSFIEEALTHLKIIQAFSQEPVESHRFGRKMDSSLKNDLTVYRLDFLLSLMVGIIIAISYSIIIGYGIQSVFAGSLTTGLLIVFIFYLDNLTNPVLEIIYAAAACRESYVKVTRMQEFFTPKTHGHFDGTVVKLEHTSIEFEHVTYKGDEGVPILHDLSFKIPENKRTVIFGVNGSGKTSVMSLILGFAEANSGHISIGGLDIHKYDIKALREAMSFVPQEITLFNDTIRSNISFPKPDVSLENIKEAARSAAAHEFIMKLPGEYNFRVGEGGSYLSGGQRQRLMLARAFIKKEAKILLFDETISALDVKTRISVLENIYRFSEGKTTVLISNVFDMVKDADHAIVLRAGEVIFSGGPSRFPTELSLYRYMLTKNYKRARTSRS